jgi:cytochrome P450
VTVSKERKYDLYSERYRAESYETFTRMREDDPVFCQVGFDGKTMLWFVTRYEDALAVLLDDERFVRDPALALEPDQLATLVGGMPEGVAFIESHMLTKDGDDHRRLRKLVSKAFTPRMVEQLRPHIQEIADELIDAVQDKGRMNLVEDFAFPLPITVIAELLGIPVEDRDRFRFWSNAIMTPAFEPQDVAWFEVMVREFIAYLRELFERRRSTPGPDLISALLQVDEGGDTLSEEELYSMVVLLIIAGHETTVSLISNAVLALLQNHDQREALERDPRLMTQAVEELLRYDSPVERSLNRWATIDIELGGQTIRKGEPLIVLLNSANRDPKRFDDPDRLDLERADVKHLAFGRGRHYCLGAPLARVEAEIALTTLLRRLPGLRLDMALEELRWRPVPLFRSLAALSVAW